MSIWKSAVINLADLRRRIEYPYQYGLEILSHLHNGLMPFFFIIMTSFTFKGSYIDLETPEVFGLELRNSFTFDPDEGSSLNFISTFSSSCSMI